MKWWEFTALSRGLPVIDVAPLVTGRPPARLAEVARQIEAACRRHGFFYVTGHGVAPELLDRLAATSGVLRAAARSQDGDRHGPPLRT